jgi:hypothetical protein
MRTSEVDKFNDMDGLEALYTLRCSAWACMADASSIKRQLLGGRLNNKVVSALSAQYVRAKETCASLVGRADEVELMSQIQILVDELQPIVEVASYLSSTALQARHWRWLRDRAFSQVGLTIRFSGRSSEVYAICHMPYLSFNHILPCHMPYAICHTPLLSFNHILLRHMPYSITILSFYTNLLLYSYAIYHMLLSFMTLLLCIQQFMAVSDISGRESLALGNMNRLNVDELVSRNMTSQLDKLCSITGEAVVEASLESTLDAVESSIKTFCVMVSGDWLRDSRLREKIFLELNEVVNVTQLSVMAKYCMKAILMVESTSQDMFLSTFENRVDKLKNQVLMLEHFVLDLGESQRQWFYLLHFVKFSPRGEVDRDSVRYVVCMCINVLCIKTHLIYGMYVY